jgi:hypothetical protein
MVSEEQNLQVQLKKVLVSMEAKRTDFEHIRQHDFIFSNAASMSSRSLSMCTMAVDDLAFSVTSRMESNSWQWR